MSEEIDIIEQLRQAVRDSPLSVNKIAKASGVPQSRLSDFMNGKEMRTNSAAKLAKYFQMRLTKPKYRA